MRTAPPAFIRVLGALLTPLLLGCVLACQGPPGESGPPGSPGEAGPRGEAGPPGSQDRQVDTIAELHDLGQTPEDGDVIHVLGYHAAGDGGGGLFRWDADSDVPDDGGVTIGMTGMAAGRWVRLTTTPVDVRWFGAVSYDSDAGEANHRAFRQALAYALSGSTTGVLLDGHASLRIPNGDWYVRGNSPFCFNRSEITALPGSYRYRRGIQIAGDGRMATNVILQNRGATTWFCDNYDPNYPAPEEEGAMDFVTFVGISFRSYPGAEIARKHPVDDASKVCGFNLRSGGWEKFFTFRDCAFAGLDQAFTFEGYGNVDHNTFYGCLFDHIIDHVFYINNNQSLQTRLYGCDIESIYGSVFKVGPAGGGDLKMYGGSVTLEPVRNTSDLPDLASTAKRAFLHVDLQDRSTTEPSLGAGNNKFAFHDLRFEFYDDRQLLTYATRNPGTIGGSIDVSFQGCSFVNEYNRDASGKVIGAPATRREAVIVENNIAGQVTFDDCALNPRHQYVLRDHGAAYLSLPTISFFDSAAYWDVLATTLGGDLRSRCIFDRTDDGMFMAERTKALYNNASMTRTMVALDFTLNASSNGSTYVYSTKYAPMKATQVPWPHAGGPALTLYLPEGSIVTEVKAYKPPQVPPPGSPVNVSYLFENHTGSDLVATTPQSEALALPIVKDLATPFIVPPPPNNYLTMTAAGAAGSPQPTGGFVLVGYL